MHAEGFDRCDVLIATCEDAGWLTIFANAKGRGAIQSVFPPAEIGWTDTRSVPPGWKAVELNLREFVSLCPDHKMIELRSDPDRSLNIYGERLAATLLLGAPRPRRQSARLSELGLKKRPRRSGGPSARGAEAGVGRSEA